MTVREGWPPFAVWQRNRRLRQVSRSFEEMAIVMRSMAPLFARVAEAIERAWPQVRE